MPYFISFILLSFTLVVVKLKSITVLSPKNNLPWRFLGLLTALSKEGLVLIQNGPDETNTSQLLDSGKLITEMIGVPVKATHYGSDFFVVENKPNANNVGKIFENNLKLSQFPDKPKISPAMNQTGVFFEHSNHQITFSFHFSDPEFEPPNFTLTQIFKMEGRLYWTLRYFI